MVRIIGGNPYPRLEDYIQDNFSDREEALDAFAGTSKDNSTVQDYINRIFPEEKEISLLAKLKLTIETDKLGRKHYRSLKTGK